MSTSLWEKTKSDGKRKGLKVNGKDSTEGALASNQQCPPGPSALHGARTGGLQAQAVSHVLACCWRWWIEGLGHARGLAARDGPDPRTTFDFWEAAAFWAVAVAVAAEPRYM